MAEQNGEKSFEPTHSRLEKAKREGDLPRSSELSGSAAFACGLLGILLAVPILAACARSAFVAAAAHPLAERNAALFGVVALALVPACCAALAGIALTFLQSGGFRAVPVALKFERLSPVEGFKRMISRESVLHAVRALAACALVLLAVLPALGDLLNAGIASQSATSLAQLAWSSALRGGFIIAVLGMFFGGADFGLLYAKWIKRLRMSFDEAKRDHKEQDGDPAAKGRRRSMHRELSRSALKRIKDAAFVIVNPTHIAIALEYHPPEVCVPRVLLRAADESALRVRQAAAEFKIPIVENVPLARALYASAKAGEVIPKDVYIAVAEIVAALSRNGALVS